MIFKIELSFEGCECSSVGRAFVQNAQHKSTIVDHVYVPIIPSLGEVHCDPCLHAPRPAWPT